MNASLTVRRSNDDPRDDTWEWLLLNERGEPIATSIRSYTSERGAWRAVRRIVPQMRSVGTIQYQGGAA